MDKILEMNDRTRFLILVGFCVLFLIFYYTIEVESDYYARDAVSHCEEAEGDGARGKIR